MVRVRLSAAEARRIAIGAQRLDRERVGSVGTRQVTGALRGLDVLQLDSVNVFERSHYLPFLARLGAYDRSLLDRLVQHDRRPRRVGSWVEYWPHVAGIHATADWPLYEMRRERQRRRERAKLEANASIVATIRDEIRANGPRLATEIEHDANVRTAGGWWNKNDVYWACESLFLTGELVCIGRDRFQRVFELAERALPDAASLPQDEAIRVLIGRAAERLGVATLDDLADYHRMLIGWAKPAVRSLVDDGTLIPVTVEGWDQPAYLHAAARIPRAIHTEALLSPFDPLVWHRPRTERLFDFYYRISIYTPEERRTEGYYVLPVLVDDRLVGRIDLKSDRQQGVLRVQHANLEPAEFERAGALAERIVPRLVEAMRWQSLDRIEVVGKGTWAAALSAAMPTTS